MNQSRVTLILTGIALIALTMFYGVYYAIFDEHQTLVAMGTFMAEGFVNAALGDLPAAFESFDAYAAVGQEYRNEVHAHGHWGMLALILIVLGLVFDRVAFSEPVRNLLAGTLALSAAIFPLGVLLQNTPAVLPGEVLAVAGSIGMVVGLLAAAWGLLRQPAEASPAD